jgi:hypothetical protein
MPAIETPSTASSVPYGKQLQPQQHTLLYSPSEWESFIHEWIHSQRSRYRKVLRFGKLTSDHVIAGKRRGSRGKGMRAITHAAFTIGLLEYCRQSGKANPGFVALDSPLLA